PTRTFNYTLPQHIIYPPESEPCGEVTTPERPSHQMLLNYTDFRGNSTVLGYDANWYVNSVTANNHTTNYTRGPNIGEITQVMHPGGSHIDYTYDDAGHYVHTVTNERTKTTTYTRDPHTHLATRIDYPQDASTP